MRGVAATWCLAILAGCPCWAIAKPAGSVKVRVVGLEAVPPDIGVQRVAVRVGIGTRWLYQTPWVAGTDPRWNRSLRAFTAARSPLVFEVLAQRVAAKGPPEEPEATTPQSGQAASSPATQDRALASGFEELVGDYEAGPSPPRDDSSSPPGGASGKTPRPSSRVPVREKVLCRIELPWPPEDGPHRLDCGGMVLVFHTTRVGEGSKTDRGK